MIDTLYRPGHSAVHSFDCRLKLFLLPLLLIYFFLPLSLPAAGLYTACFAVLILIYLGFRDLLIPLKMIFPLLILITLITPLFHRTGTVLISAGDFTLLTGRGLDETIRYLARFSGISFLFFLFFRSTAMDDILLGLSWYRLPYTLTLVISIALRYIPHLAGLYGQIKAAHALRCSIEDDLPRSRGIGKIRNLFPVLVSLVIQSVKTIPVLTMALELKGIGRSNPRSQSRTLITPESVRIQIFSSLLLIALLITNLILFSSIK
ncbi:MAG: energy-coupling factor transporter transmembrane component T [Spirochaetales bacterium]|nr:energy-coupling factor transporter transmembrane component T [Spirochaetales bacterium]